MKIEFNINNETRYIYLGNEDIAIDEDFGNIFILFESEDYLFAERNFFEKDKVENIENYYNSLKSYFGHCVIRDLRRKLVPKNALNVKFIKGE